MLYRPNIPLVDGRRGFVRCLTKAIKGDTRVIMIDEKDIVRLRTEAERQRRQAIQAADAKYAADLTAIDTVAALVNGGHTQTAPVQQMDIPQMVRNAQHHAGKNGNGAVAGLRTMIRGAISRQQGKFSISEIMNDLGRVHPAEGFNRTLISGELWSLARRGEIQTVEKGKGRLPNVYTKRKEAEV